MLSPVTHTPQLNETHRRDARSWVESANDPATDFPIQNLPYGVFLRSGDAPRGGVAIGDCIFDLAAALKAGLFSARPNKRRILRQRLRSMRSWQQVPRRNRHCANASSKFWRRTALSARRSRNAPGLCLSR